ncbi:fibulin-5 isoform X3 [Silurus meridionalis]|uniref:fibulin-5 isoform X3 n=1 Tax=Silurus meridionalis TaxID=175797 RepID=UPI001EEBBF53|nr:fibulin-5 isoform X3 [Silurus meridionalis]XP_046695956.1 fibulin-5 isoform X3 [Silurus meridionalis]
MVSNVFCDLVCCLIKKGFLCFLSGNKRCVYEVKLMYFSCLVPSLCTSISSLLHNIPPVSPNTGKPHWISMEALGATLLIMNWVLVLGAAAAVDCGGFGHLENGRTFFRYGGLYVTFSCNPGFRMHGHRISSCVSGQWVRRPPLCVAPGCRSPGKILHGNALMSPDGSLVHFTCNTGFGLFGSPFLYCKGKSWNGSTPVCKGLTPCIMNNGGCSQVCRLNTHNRAECRCDPGFQLLGDQMTCRDLDECVEGLHECQQVCENTFGSYRCSCTPGFQLSFDRISCTDVNECMLPASMARCGSDA